MGYFDNALISKINFGILCFALIMWLITACVDVVNFEESNKTMLNADGTTSNTSAWSTSIAMISMSSIIMFLFLIALGVGIYLKTQTGGVAAVAAAATA